MSSAKGSCELSATRFGPGSYNLAASYGGDSDFAPSSDAVGTAVTVFKASSSTGLRLSTAKVTYGHEQAERLSVSVTPEFAGTPTGRVAVTRGKTTLCEITLSSGKGSCTLAPTRLGAGKYASRRQLRRRPELRRLGRLGRAGVARLQGHLLHRPQVVGFEGDLRPRTRRAPVGQGDARIPRDAEREHQGEMGATTLCEITLSSGKGSCTLAPTKLGAGTYHLGATYEGSSDFRGSVSAPETLTIPFSA